MNAIVAKAVEGMRKEEREENAKELLKVILSTNNSEKIKEILMSADREVIRVLRDLPGIEVFIKGFSLEFLVWLEYFVKYPDEILRKVVGSYFPGSLLIGAARESFLERERRENRRKGAEGGCSTCQWNIKNLRK